MADLLRIGRLAQAWIAPPAVRELRELVRYRHKLVATRSAVNASCRLCGLCDPLWDTSGGEQPAGYQYRPDQETLRLLA